MAHYTVLGANGFIGSSLVRHLRAHGHDCDSIGRKDPLPARLGHTICCIGVSADFRSRPFDTIEANVSCLVPLLRDSRFESFTYLSSTRLYHGHAMDEVAHEDLPLSVNPGNTEDLYNASKLAGEALCLTMDNPAIRVVRLANVYGSEDRSDNFLTIVLRQVLTRGTATFFNAMESQKDYIALADVLMALELVPVRATSRVMNIARGRNVTNQELADLIARYTGSTIRVLPNAPVVQFPRIDVSRLTAQMGLFPRDLADEFPSLVAGMQKALLGVTP